jgi:L-ascorbate metabolism protein UlaG (beta-lactamase superfamily)
MAFGLDLSHILKSFGGKQSEERKRSFETTGHYKDGIFLNTVPTRTLQPGVFLQVLKGQIFKTEKRVPEIKIPVQPRQREDFKNEPTELRATWMGHASVLLEIDGHTVLTDPVWSDRCSPSQNLGPKRFFAPPLPLEKLPKIDFVLISHDHYDHLDMDSILFLAKQDLKFLVPLGVGAHLEFWKVPSEKIVEMNWHESIQSARGLTITATPARHFSGRTLFDRNTTFWNSFSIAGPHHKVFYTGDSGYFDEYKKVGERYGPFDLTLMQIGACSKYWPDIHLFPEDAVQAHLDLRGDLFLPVHWGTFNLAFHAWNDPAYQVLKAAQTKNVRITLPKPGQTVNVKDAPLTLDWWRD